jgi:hypothetical protein
MPGIQGEVPNDGKGRLLAALDETRADRDEWRARAERLARRVVLGGGHTKEKTREFCREILGDESIADTIAALAEAEA